jgi:two-component system OmpR family response regulator
MRVLVVEETSSWRRLSAAVWALEGIAADVALDGEQALVRAGATRYDLVVLDVMLPDGDGFVVCRRLREHGACAGVLMLTARNTIEDRVHGLDSGADDYLGKPFSFAELLARVRALRRRTTIERPVVLEVGDLRFDTATHRAWRSETPVDLSTTELAVLGDVHAPSG